MRKLTKAQKEQRNSNVILTLLGAVVINSVVWGLSGKLDMTCILICGMIVIGYMVKPHLNNYGIDIGSGSGSTNHHGDDSITDPSHFLNPSNIYHSHND